MFINILIIAILIIFKSIFTASETSFTYLNRSKINQMAKSGDKKAIRIRKMLEKPNKFFSTIKVGITFLEYVASTYAAESFLSKIQYQISFFNVTQIQIKLLSIMILTVILAYIMIIFGDLLPKKIAKNSPEKTSFLLITPLYILSVFIYPFEIILNVSIDCLSKIFNIKDESNEKLTEKEIKMIISEGKDEGLLDAHARRIMINTLKFDDLLIKDIMKPRDKTLFLDINSSSKSLMASLRKYQYTRVPIYDGKIDNVIGILNMKDIILKYGKGSNIFKIDIKMLLRKPFFIDKEDKVDEIFKVMQLNAQSIAIVKNADVVEGIVTIEDMLEKIVGNIFDEYDKVQLDE